MNENISYISYPIEPELFQNSDVEHKLEETLQFVLYCKKHKVLSKILKSHLMSTSCCIFPKVFKVSQSIFLAEAGTRTEHDIAALLMSGGFAEMGTFDSS